MERVQWDERAGDQVQKRSESDPQVTQRVVTLCSPHPGPCVAGRSPVMVTEAICLTLLWCSQGGCHQANQLAGEVVGTAFSNKGYHF